MEKTTFTKNPHISAKQYSQKIDLTVKIFVLLQPSYLIVQMMRFFWKKSSGLPGSESAKAKILRVKKILFFLNFNFFPK